VCVCVIAFVRTFILQFILITFWDTFTLRFLDELSPPPSILVFSIVGSFLMLCVYVAARVLSQQNGRQWAKLWLHVHCSHSRRSVSIGFVPAELRREAKQALGALQRPKVLPPFGSYLGRYVYHHNPSIIWFYRPRPTERDSNSRVNSSSLLHPSRLGTFRAGGVGTSAVGGERGRRRRKTRTFARLRGWRNFSAGR